MNKHSLKGYINGLNTAWDCARRITTMTPQDRIKYFNCASCSTIFHQYSAFKIKEIFKNLDKEVKQNDIT